MHLFVYGILGFSFKHGNVRQLTETEVSRYTLPIVSIYTNYLA